MTAGLLYLYSDVSGELPDFDDWYDGHSKDRLKYSGIKKAQRYKATDNKSPSNLAVYEVDDIAGLETEEYKGIKPADEEREKNAVSQITFDRRVYKLLKQWGEFDGTPEVLQPNCMTPGEANEADQEEWYEKEHIPLFKEIKGWQRTRRYILVDRKVIKNGKLVEPETVTPKFLTVHNWSKDNDLGGEKRKAAAATAWTAKVKGYMEYHEGPRMFELYKEFKA